MTTASQIDRYTDFLCEMEIKSQREESLLHFEHQGLHFVLCADEADPSYFRLELPGIWLAGSPQEHLLGLQVASEVTRTTKAVKLSFQGPIASAAVECFEPTPDGYRAIFLRALSALQFAAQSFRHHTSVVLALARAAGAVEGAAQDGSAPTRMSAPQAQRRMGFGGAAN